MSSSCAPDRWLLRVALALLAALAGAVRPVPRAAAHADLEFVKEKLDEQVREHPGDPERELQQAQVHQAAGDWDSALVAYAHALEHGADPDRVGSARGIVYLEAGFPRMAILELDRVLARRPEAAGALYDRGRARLKLGELALAEDDLGRAIATLPQPRPEQVFLHRDTLLALGRRDDAIRAIDAGIGRIGHAVSLELAALDLEIEAGHLDAALRRMEGLLEREPGNEIWVARRADMLEKVGRPGEARAEYARALRMIERRPAARRGIERTSLATRLHAILGSASTGAGSAATDPGAGDTESQGSR